MTSPLTRRPTLYESWITTRWPPLRTYAVLAIVVAVIIVVAGVWWYRSLRTIEALSAGALAAVVLIIAGWRVAVVAERGIAFRSLALGVLSASGVTLTAAAVWSRAVGSGTPPPPFTIGDHQRVDSTQRALLLLHVQEDLHFDDSTHRAWDDRIAIDKDSLGRRVIGPRMRIEPESRAYLNSQRALRRGGRIVARIWVDTTYRAPRRGDTGGYAPLKLPPGLSYVWIDSLRVTGKGEGRARALIIPANPRDSIRTDSVRYTFRRRVWETYSRALWRWSFTRDPECYNVTCPWGCCENCWNQD